MEYGTVCEITDDKSGYIMSNNLESIYFKKSDFETGYIIEGMYVSFFTEKCFVESLNQEIIKAIDIREE